MIYWHFIGLLLVVALATIQGRVGRIGSLGMILLALPSTVLHELAHFLTALVTGGRPTSFNIIPRAQTVETSTGPRRKWTLGSVGFYPTTFSAVPTALAPLLFIPAAVYLYGNWFDWFAISGGNILWLYLAIYLFLSAAIPSWPDIKIVLTHPKSLGAYAVGLTLMYLAREPIAQALREVGRFLSL